MSTTFKNALLVFVAMMVGTFIGVYAPQTRERLWPTPAPLMEYSYLVSFHYGSPDAKAPTSEGFGSFVWNIYGRKFTASDLEAVRTDATKNLRVKTAPGEALPTIVPVAVTLVETKKVTACVPEK